jgi:putative polymerase
MTAYALAPELGDARFAARTMRILPGLLVIGAVTFNALLAIINAHVTPLSAVHVIAAETAFVVGAHALAIANYQPAMTRWYALALLFVLLALYRSLAFGQIEAKYLRDVLLIPTFIVLGMTFDHRNLTRVVVSLHILVLIVLLFEALNTTAYASLFRIQDYYISTRGYDAQNFWNKESDLYVSAVRPDERMFGFIDLHRLSSIFLEPVSLGNYCIVITAFICARFSQLGTLTRIILIVGNVIALIGCDGRLAAVASVLMVAASMIAPRLPRYSAILYLPAVVGIAFALVGFAGLHAGGDDFPGRIAHTVELIAQFDTAEFLGLSDEYLNQAVDSGLAYLITTQSLLGPAILWVFIVYGSDERTAEQIRFTHGVCIYIALTLMVSFAFLSIKTSALLWFIYGVLQTQASAEVNASPRSDGEFVPAYASHQRT